MTEVIRREECIYLHRCISYKVGNEICSGGKETQVKKCPRYRIYKSGQDPETEYGRKFM